MQASAKGAGCVEGESLMWKQDIIYPSTCQTCGEHVDRHGMHGDCPTLDRPPRHPLDEHIALADGTDTRRYQPMPGDVVSIDCRGFDPCLNMYGTRVGTVRHVSPVAGYDVAVVSLPGFLEPETVDVEWLSLAWRRPVP